MSKLKTPQRKKAASLEHDRRNAYRENSKASRKNIPRAKARVHRAERHEVARALQVVGELQSDAGLEAATTRLHESKLQRRQGFKKTPDVPLGQVVEETLARRASRPKPKR